MGGRGRHGRPIVLQQLTVHDKHLLSMCERLEQVYTR